MHMFVVHVHCTRVTSIVRIWFTRSTYFEVRAEVASDEGTVTLRQDGDLLLDVLDLILSLLQVDDLDGDHLLRALVDSLEHFAEGALPDALQLRERLFGIHFVLQQRIS